MIYLVLRDVHIACAMISGLGFFVRGLWKAFDSPLQFHRWTRIVPHVIDTVLLSSAVSLAVVTRQYPIEQSWLTAKVLALLAYIGCGMVAFRFGRSRGARVVFFGLALASYTYIVSAAMTRNPAGWFAFFQ